MPPDHWSRDVLPFGPAEVDSAHGQFRHRQRHCVALAVLAACRAGRGRLVGREVVAKEAADDIAVAVVAVGLWLA